MSYPTELAKATMTNWQDERLTELFHNCLETEEYDLQNQAKSIQAYIVQLMHEAYKQGWVDSGRKADELR